MLVDICHPLIQEQVLLSGFQRGSALTDIHKALMLSDIWLDFWVVICKARNWTLVGPFYDSLALLKANRYKCKREDPYP